MKKSKGGKKLIEISTQKPSKRTAFFQSTALIAKNLLDSVSPYAGAIPSNLMGPLQFVLGSSIDILLSIYSSQEMETRFQLLILQLNKNFSIVGKKLEKMEKNYEIYWRKALKGSLGAIRKEKIKLFANVLTNYAFEKDRPFSTKSSILNDLDFLELEHIKLLTIVHKDKLKEDKRLQKDNNYKRTYCLIEYAGKKLKTNYADVWKLATDLLGRGLLTDPSVGTYGYRGFKKMGISQYGEYFIKAIKSYGK